MNPKSNTRIMPQIVLDPTLLCEPEYFEFEKSKPYIAVYLFYDSMDKKLVNEIISFAHAHDLLLISAGQYISWCDFSVHSKNGNPFYIFKNALYVITNTFHGTAYAINYKTKFVSYAKGKKKIEELLQEFELENRIAENVGDLENILKRDINYEVVSKNLARLRKESMLYLSNSFDKARSSFREGGLAGAK